MATFVSALQGEGLALPITMAIAIHNIPEGVAVAVPLFYATGSRKKALGYSLLSGLSEPLGALIGYLLLRPFMSDTLMGILFGAIAGVMVYISLDELLPSAEEYGETPSGHARGHRRYGGDGGEPAALRLRGEKSARPAGTFLHIFRKCKGKIP